MKKIVLLLCVLVLTACVEESSEKRTYSDPIDTEAEEITPENTRFILSGETSKDHFKMLEDTYTGCKYIIYNSVQAQGRGAAMTPLLKLDGTPDCGDIQ